MREYTVELLGTSKKSFSIIAESAEEASKYADLIMRKTNMVQFDNNDVGCVELEIFPAEETDYADDDVHIGEVKMGKDLNSKSN